jgi:hypothetical protein
MARPEKRVWDPKLISRELYPIRKDIFLFLWSFLWQIAFSCIQKGAFYDRLPFMDKSRQYIQMCKRSKEIQSLWQPKTGDFYADIGSEVHCYFPDSSKTGAIKSGFGITTGKKVTTISPLVWLPKLEQLIEAAQVQGCCFRDTSFQFYEWVKLPYGKGTIPANKLFISLEQVWLAFIMKTRFGKIWEDGGWNSVTLLTLHS